MGTPFLVAPHEFFVECPQCGVYRISEDTARKFLTPRLRVKLDKRLRNGAVGAKLKFKGGCPTCEPEGGTNDIELVALHPRRN
jgi:hypothetical protein